MSGLNMRDIAGNAANESKPKSTKKRVAPNQKRTLTLEEKAELEERQGKPKSYRLRPQTVDAVSRAAKQHGVRVGPMADFLLSASLTLLAQGRIELPKAAELYELDLPPVPEDYR